MQLEITLATRYANGICGVNRTVRPANEMYANAVLTRPTIR